MFMVLTLNSRILWQDSPVSIKKKKQFSFSKDLAVSEREKRFNDESPAKHALSSLLPPVSPPMRKAITQMALMWRLIPECHERRVGYEGGVSNSQRNH